MKLPKTPRLPPAVAMLSIALLVGGCDGLAGSLASGTGASGGLGLAPPAALMQSRVVDRTRLRPNVSIVGGPEVPMSRVGDRWRGTVDVAPGRDYGLVIVWIENVVSGERQRDLPLARLEGTVSVGADGGMFTVGADAYDLELDFDGDGAFNLAEREANTDPFGDEAPRDDASAPPAGEVEESVEPDSDVETPTMEGPLDAPLGEPDDEQPAREPLDNEPDGDDPGASDVPEPVTPPVDGTPEEPAEPLPPVTIDEPVVPEPVEEEPLPTVDADVVIPRIAPSDAPGIDGRNVAMQTNGVRDGEWAAATSFDARGSRLFIDRLMVDNGTDESNGQAFRAWSAMHDGEYLYVLVVVEDDGRRVRDSEQVWRDDSLEIYVDGNNSRNPTYMDGEDDDSSRLIPLLEPGTTRQGTTDGLVSGFLSVDAPIRIDFATGPGIGPAGIRRPRFEQDVYEVRIDLDSAGILPGRPFGFELQVNDDDDGGDREAKWGWAHPARTDVDIDFTFRDPSFMGTAVLE